MPHSRALAHRRPPIFRLGGDAEAGPASAAHAAGGGTDPACACCAPRPIRPPPTLDMVCALAPSATLPRAWRQPGAELALPTAVQLPVQGSVHALDDDPDAALRELCACCLQVDFDEPCASVRVLVNRPCEDASHTHARTAPQAQGALEWAVNGLTGYAFVAGVYIGNMNRTTSRQTAAELRRRLAACDDVLGRLQAQRRRHWQETMPQLSWGQAQKLQWVAHQAEKQLQAQRRGMVAGLGMQRFIEWVAGNLSAANASLMFAGVFAPALGTLAGLGLVAYCGAHVLRYLGWERRRAQVALRLRPGQALDPWARAGAQRFAQLQAQRRRLFAQVSAGFAVYGAGMGTQLLAEGCNQPGWRGPGLLLMLAGLSTVTLMNNFSVQHAFQNNRDTHVDRAKLAGKGAILRQLSFYQREAAALQVLAERLRARQAPRLLTRLREGSAILTHYLSLGQLFAGATQAPRRRRLATWRQQVPQAELQAHLRVSAGIKVAHLAQEQGALQARCAQQHSLATTRQVAAPDEAAIAATRTVLGFWTHQEERQLPASSSSSSSSQLAGSLWAHLSCRDMLQAVAAHVDAPRGGAAAFAPDGLLDLARWRRGLDAGDPAAQTLLRALQAASAEHLTQVYLPQLRERSGSLVDLLVDRSRGRRSQAVG